MTSVIWLRLHAPISFRAAFFCSADRPCTKKSMPRIIEPNQKRRREAEERAYVWIVCTFNKKGTVPSVTEVMRSLRAGHAVAKRERERFLKELERQQKQTAYINTLINSQNHSTGRRKKNMALLIPFRSKDQEALDDGVYALFNSFPDKLFLLTLVCPSDSEIAYLVLSRNTAETADELMASLWEFCQCQYAAYRWEIQTSGRLHLHFLCAIETSTLDQSELSRRLTAFWKDCLTRLGDRSSCDFFVNQHGSRCKGEWSDYTDVRSYREQENEIFYRSYLATNRKNGKQQCNSRYLNELGGLYVSPKIHYGLSPALSCLVDETTYKMCLSFNSRYEAEAVVEQIQLQLRCFKLDHPWGPFRPNRLPGVRCRVKARDYLAVRKVVMERVTRLNQSAAGRGNFTLSVKMGPQRYLKLYIDRRKAKGAAQQRRQSPIQNQLNWPKRSKGFDKMTVYDKGVEFYTNGFAVHQWKHAAFCLGYLFWCGNPELGIHACGHNDQARFEEILKVFARNEVSTTDEVLCFIWKQVTTRKPATRWYHPW